MTPQTIPVLNEDERDLAELLTGTGDGADVARRLRAEFPHESASEVITRYIDVMAERARARKARDAEKKALGVAWDLLVWLQAQPEGVTVKAMCDHFGRPQQTVQKWLATLQRHGKVRVIQQAPIWAPTA